MHCQQLCIIMKNKLLSQFNYNTIIETFSVFQLNSFISLAVSTHHLPWPPSTQASNPWVINSSNKQAVITVWFLPFHCFFLLGYSGVNAQILTNSSPSYQHFISVTRILFSLRSLKKIFLIFLVWSNHPLL